MKVFYLFFGLLFPGFVISMEMETGRSRNKRAMGDLIQLEPRTPAEIQVYLDGYNGPRRTKGASNMQLLTWSNELADFAKNHVSQCVEGNSLVANRSTTNYQNIGESVTHYRSNTLATAAIDGTFTTAAYLRYFFNQGDHYTYADQSCAVGQDCSPYIQGVWANTSKIGCAKAWCRRNSTNPPKQTVLIMCNFAPAGNIINPTTGRAGIPYLIGPACSACPSGDGCDNGLCTNPVRDAGCHEENPNFSGVGLNPCNACGPPNPVLNATYTPIQTLYQVNSTVSFTCSAGTLLRGNAMIRCQANITWTAPPRCLRICPSPSAINGSYTPMGLYTEGSVIVYVCFSNYVLWGNSSRTCQPDGQWTPPPTCAPDRCGAGPCLNGGTCRNQNTQVGYMCVCTAQHQGQRCENAKFQFVQRTNKPFREEFNNLNSLEALAFIAEFKRIQMQLFRISNIVDILVQKLSRGSTIVQFEALVGPSSANVTHEELLIEINRAIDSNTFNTSLLIDRPTADLPNITAECGMAPAQDSISPGTLQNAVLDSSLSCAENLIGIRFNACNLTRSGITADRIVIAGPGQDVLNVSASCKPNFIRTSDGQTSATFLL